MDFECGDWDVTGEATQLVNNLFGTSKKKKTKKRKVAVEAKETNHHEELVEPSNLQNMIASKAKLEDRAGSENSSKKSKKKKKKKHVEESSDLSVDKNSVIVKKHSNNAIKSNHMNKTNESQQYQTNSPSNSVQLSYQDEKVNPNNTSAKKRKMDDGCAVSNDKKSKTIQSNTDKTSANTGKKKKRKCKKNKFKDYSKEEDLKGQKITPDLVSSNTNENEPSVVKEKEVALSSDIGNGTMSKQSKQKSKDEVSGIKPKHLANETAKSKFDAAKLGALLASSKCELKTDVKKDKDKQSINNANEQVLDAEPIIDKSSSKSLLEKSRDRLNAARFRYLNEQLYSSTGHDAYNLFKQDKDAFHVYHAGFQNQVEKWPTNPVDIIIGIIKAKPKHLVVADFGCGDAKIAQNVANKVHSFDLVALNNHVTVCDIAKIPLGPASVDIGVFCLSLMGTNLSTYLGEANRVLKTGGTMYIAEVTSRFANIGQFVLQVEKMGFKCLSQDSGNKMFVLMTFRKTGDFKVKDSGSIQLKPCVYKKR
ncbi:ribosomal RNA-processing protein 8-like [Dreissena polymorpha]|nr:ribosomal RNA-processing protein 8-like [Dreissena polymorpha]